MRLMLNVFADIQNSLHVFFEEFVLGVIPRVIPLHLPPVSCLCFHCLFMSRLGRAAYRFTPIM